MSDFYAGSVWTTWPWEWRWPWSRPADQAPGFVGPPAHLATQPKKPAPTGTFSWPWQGWRLPTWNEFWFGAGHDLGSAAGGFASGVGAGAAGGASGGAARSAEFLSIPTWAWFVIVALFVSSSWAQHQVTGGTRMAVKGARMASTAVKRHRRAAAAARAASPPRPRRKPLRWPSRKKKARKGEQTLIDWYKSGKR